MEIAPLPSWPPFDDLETSGIQKRHGPVDDTREADAGLGKNGLPPLLRRSEGGWLRLPLSDRRTDPPGHAAPINDSSVTVAIRLIFGLTLGFRPCSKSFCVRGVDVLHP